MLKLKKNIIFYLFIFISIIICTFSVNSEPLFAKYYYDFDHYILAISCQESFFYNKKNKYKFNNLNKYLLNEKKCKDKFLTIHGLWPGLPQSVYSNGITEKDWIRFGCYILPTYNLNKLESIHKSTSKIRLSIDTIKKTNEIISDKGKKSYLRYHEYTKHGVCFGFDPDTYFNTMIRLYWEIRMSPIGYFIINHRGKTVSRIDFDTEVSKVWGSKNIKAIKLKCCGKDNYLKEIQIFIKTDYINKKLSSNSFLPQLNVGNCGNYFNIE